MLNLNKSLSDEAQKSLPANIIELAVHDWIKENQESLTKFIMNRLGDFVMRIQDDHANFAQKVIFIRQEELERSLIDVQFEAQGICPECKEKVKGYRSPQGYFAPEMYATLREGGIDPTSGHKFTCSKANYSS